MKTKVFKVDVGTLKGEVEARLPTFDERYQYLDALEIDLDKEEKKTEDEINQRSTKDKILMVRRMVALSLKHYVSVDVRDEETGDEFKSVDDLNYGGEGHAVLVDLASKIINGGIPKTKPQSLST